MPKTVRIPVDNLDAEIRHYTKDLGYRLDMIVPADAPREALLSKDGESVRLTMSPGFSRQGRPKGGTQNEWITGRAGMEYRDLIPGRLGGKLIASHIRLTTGGEVPDYVHYHKVRFQMIYCLKGATKVVYEDQGPPFWLNPGDCVLQPPEIRHRVLECTAGSEVIEIGMPAVHETWVEHSINLPTAGSRPHRAFGGQQFVHQIAAAVDWNSSITNDVEFRDTGIMAATGGLADVRVIRAKSGTSLSLGEYAKYGIRFVFVLNGTVALEDRGADDVEINAGNGLALKAGGDYSARVETGTEFLLTVIDRA